MKHQCKTSTQRGEGEQCYQPQTELGGVATGFYMPARRSRDRQQDSKVAGSSTRGGVIRVSEQVDSAAVSTGQLHLLLAVAARKLSQ